MSSPQQIRTMLEMRASHHIIMATEMLVLLGDGEKIAQIPHRITGSERNQALAMGARAHIDMARFKLDHPDVMQKINHGRPNIED